VVSRSAKFCKINEDFTCEVREVQESLAALMSLSTRLVTKENWRALIKISVREDQRHFVSPNVYSIAQAQFGFDHQGHWELQVMGSAGSPDTPNIQETLKLHASATQISLRPTIR
jgi:hypothetical protein